MTKGKVVVVGSINADLATQVSRHPNPGETLLGTGGTTSPGGKGANQAVAAALQGADVAMVGAVGNDSLAEAALSRLRSSGVNMEAIATVDGPTGLAVITVAEGGENTIIVVAGANASMDAEAVRAHRQLIEEADVVLLQGEIPADGFNEAVNLATGRVVTNLAPVVEVGEAELKKANPLVVNEHEAELVLTQLGISPEGSVPRQLASQLHEAGFASVVITLGDQGVLVADNEGFVSVPTPQVDAVDTTGCGDAFSGALVAKLAEGENLREAAVYAARVGAFAATKPGAQSSYPTLSDALPE